ncbi:hypothetical protein CYLTODRAFT_485065 [Cylindrobasidium torrendii FP15055 ss-10]|uniref:Mid2 domain-containing protein n=1 Tax=Cylindrobasidium torrendii FP15055 ss-10 TaxID=1314674 RepID=A0A0D7BWB2_9AGAR|nr:hypothetical protein CYLTODRAFT_485065 [Cylindrobasidium torrendii FP15055 ss-10]
MLCSVLLFAVLWHTVQAYHNVTVDDSDARVIYNGSWDQGNHQSSLDYNGSHALSYDPTASASFSFTGVAIYYLSSMWPYPVNSTVTLDGEDSVFLNLTDPGATPANGGSASAQWGPRWFKTGLSNTTHELVVTMSSKQGGTWIVVDGFIYTVDDGNNTNGTDSSGASTSSSGSSSIVPIAVGVAIGIVTFLASVGLAIWFWFWRKRQSRQESASRMDVDEVRTRPFLLDEPPTFDQSMANTPATTPHTSHRFPSDATSFPPMPMSHADDDILSLMSSSPPSAAHFAAMGVGEASVAMPAHTRQYPPEKAGYRPAPAYTPRNL